MTIVTSMLRISHNGVLLKIPTPLTLLVQAQELAESFANSILPDTVLSIELHAQFLQFCSSRNPALARVAFDAFEHAFCPDTDIHAAIKDMALTEPQARVVVRGYFSVWGILPSPPARRLALFTDPGVKLMATFGGQGGMDNYMDELSWLVDVYRPLVFEFFATMAEFLRTEAMDTRIAGLYKRGLDVANWVARPETLPELPYMLHVPVSMPVVGLIHLMHLMVLYKTLRMTPGELAQSFH
ncbi:fatty acid synthase alpha subunit Lsd1, partial [Linderina pennispora]